MALSTMDLKRKILQLDAEIIKLNKRNAELEATLYDATDGISGTLARDEVERLREVAAAVYGNWAGGEPVDDDMKEIGKLLGFEVKVP